MDSLYFSAYNRCDLDTQASMLSDSVEFYHDQGGLSTSKKDILEKTKENICGKVTREVVAGSIELYPIKDYGAVEIGMHKFHNNQEPKGTPSHASKFIVIWQHQNNSWQMARVISLH
ncbi:MAG: nuclear transport factor 2 family protein [Flavobacteriales bacterium]|nr:MAG: nuclear transport factor 2 family protein [Flavobacteriales bacterium]